MTHQEESQKLIDEAVISVARDLETNFVEEIENALEITPLPNGDVRILRCTGGPHIEIDTHHQMVIGYWGGKRAVAFFDQSIAQQIKEYCDLCDYPEE